MFTSSLAEADPAIDAVLKGELHRQREQIELIASENIVSRAVLEAAGSVLTNKYAEGYPGRRYYGGCEEVDKAEQLAIERACKLFNCSFANVQPHSGAQANQAVFMALLQPGDKFLGMALDQGGHLTHGSPANQSGKWFKVVSYGVKPDSHLIDYEQMEAVARQEKPKLIVAGASAYSRHIDWARFRKVADEIGAFFMVDMAHYAGLVAAGVYPSPLPHAHVVTTTTHKTLRGPRGGMVLSNDAEIGKKINSAVFPGLQGGPLMHIIAAKAVALRRGAAARLQGLRPERHRQCARARRGADRARPEDRLGRHRQPRHAGRPAAQEGDRRGGREGARPRRHHRQQEQHSGRSGEIHDHLGRAAGLAGRHDARLRRRRSSARSAT